MINPEFERMSYEKVEEEFLGNALFASCDCCLKVRPDELVVSDSPSCLITICLDCARKIGEIAK